MPPRWRRPCLLIEKIVTGLKFKTPPKLETQNASDEVRAFLEKKFNDDIAGARARGRRSARTSSSVCCRTRSIFGSIMLSLLTEQVVGYYDPATKVLYVVDGGGTPQAPRLPTS